MSKRKLGNLIMLQYNLNPSRISYFNCQLWKLRFSFFPFAKRLLDIAIASFALLALSPVIILVAILIKLDSEGSVLFKQERLGLHGMPFSMWKLRSMSIDAERKRPELDSLNDMQQGVLFKMKADPRITRIGVFIRKTSIDELPQLLNVLRGEMALVGPRPPLPSEVVHYTRNDRSRLSVLPGITCIWQISGRSDIPFEEQVLLDLTYIEQQSIRMDLSVLIKTIPAVLLARGAY
ncbi:MAG: lipopolysaccharide/colanic/teichoic acid biosynthesis glycosyltransferase [Pseudoalteromonas tetraodonis]|jgi:lipopolysaccharide/colanic/teichoic acid biosynthesis glycosyltransferase